MKTKIYVTLLIALLCLNTYSQDNKIKEIKIGYSGTPSLVDFNTDTKKNYTKGQEKAIWEKYLGVSGSDKLELVKTRTGKNGMEHQKYQQYYKGVKVEGGVYALHIKEGNIESANGTFLKIGDLDINPVLFEEEAVLAAIESTKAARYAWESEGMENIIRQENNDEKATYYPEAELVIWHPYRENKPNLAYKIEIYSLEPLNREYVYIDANSGKILSRDPIMKAGSEPCGGLTRYSGTQAFMAEHDQNVYRLLDKTRANPDGNGGIHVMDLQRSDTTYINSAIEFENSNSSWFPGSWPEWDTLKNNAALDAIWALEGTYDYFRDEHDWRSYNGDNSKIDCYVHLNRVNAYWVGTYLALGDGYDTVDAFTSIDIIAHELAHGFCQATSDLRYQKASGAINESLSDIWGAVVEYDMAPTKQTWRCGEDILNNSAVRAMDNPHLYGQPDTYGTNDTFWYDYSSCTPTENNDYCGVHRNVGVMNYWFYLLSQGGSGTNANGNGYNFSGLGINNAADIVFSMEADGYLNYVFADFDDTRTASLQAASALEDQEVLDAWYAVGVGKPKITGTDLMCSSASFEVEDLPSWSNSIIWEQSSNLTRTSAQGANPCTFTHNGDGEGWIQARIVRTIGDTLNSSIKTVWVGVPVIETIDGASSTEVDETEVYHASYDLDCDPTDFYWGAYPYYQGLTVSPSSGYDWTYITFPEADNYTVVTQLQNTCGWSSFAYKPVSVSGSKSATIENSASPEIPDGTGNNISLYPNPAKKEVTISVGSKLLTADKDIQYWDLEVYNPAQVLVYKKAGLKSPETGITTEGWVEGMYLVRIKIGETILNRKLVIAK